MAGKNPSVDGFLRKASRWREEMALLREIVLETAKRSKTRSSSVERCIPEILAGKGFNEDYLEGRSRASE